MILRMLVNGTSVKTGAAPPTTELLTVGGFAAGGEGAGGDGEVELEAGTAEAGAEEEDEG